MFARFVAVSVAMYMDAQQKQYGRPTGGRVEIYRGESKKKGLLLTSRTFGSGPVARWWVDRAKADSLKYWPDHPYASRTLK